MAVVQVSLLLLCLLVNLGAIQPARGDCDLLVYKQTLTGHCSAVTQNTAAQGQKSIAVDSCLPFWSKKRVMIHQTQGPGHSAGRYQLVDIQGCQHKKLILREPLRDTYYSGAFGGTSPKVTQVVPLIQANNVVVCSGRIEAPTWNGRCGGIVAIQAQRNVLLCVGSAISATGKGFRGAPQYKSRHDWVYGYIGESELVGYSARRQKEGVGLGGGAGNGNAGGAGGAHKTVGTAPTTGGCSKGGPGAKPAGVISTCGADRLYFGGSGGAAGSHGQHWIGRFGAKGGASGGVVYLEAKGNIKAPAKSIQACGLSGQNGYLIPSKKQAMGGGGGGAGGTVAYKQGWHKYPVGAIVNGGAGGSAYPFKGSCKNAGSGGSGGVGEFIKLA